MTLENGERLANGPLVDSLQSLWWRGHPAPQLAPVEQPARWSTQHGPGGPVEGRAAGPDRLLQQVGLSCAWRACRLAWTATGWRRQRRQQAQLVPPLLRWRPRWRRARSAGQARQQRCSRHLHDQLGGGNVPPRDVSQLVGGTSHQSTTLNLTLSISQHTRTAVVAHEDAPVCSAPLATAHDHTLAGASMFAGRTAANGTLAAILKLFLGAIVQFEGSE